MIKQAFTYTDLYACAFALYLICHTVGTSDNLMDKNDWLIWGCVALCYAAVRCLTRSCQCKLLGIIAITGFIQSLIAWGQFCGWAESNHNNFPVTGSFKNPAPLAGYIGACLILIVEFMSLCYKENRKTIFTLLIPAAASISGIIILSYSRAAWIALLISLIHLLARHRKIRYRHLFPVAVLCLSCLAALYFLKKESADARLFIWKNSGQLLHTSPLTGSGVNTFASRYMYTQAEYFANHPDSPYKLKASDNSHAFNEYLRIIVEYGIIGLILLFLLFRSMSFFHPVLSFYCIFAFFSYPLEITPIILLVTVMAASYPGKNICYYPRYILITICLSASCLLSYRAWRFKSEERELKSMIHEYGCLPGAGLEDKLFGYYPCYKNNHIYIASCAMQFYKNKSYPKAEVMLRRASVLFPSSRILYDLGNCCHRLQKYEEAERFLSIACDMAPGHVLPQYYLFRHYVETGQTHKALNSAHTIIHSKFKQEGSTALQVKHLAKEYLSKTKEGGERE